VNDYVPSPDGRYVRLREFLAEQFKRIEENSVVVFYSVSGGIASPDGRGVERLAGLLPGGELPRSPSGALPLLERFLKLDGGRIMVVIEDVDKIAPCEDAVPHDRRCVKDAETLRRWARHPELETSNHLIVLLSENLTDVASCLRREGNGIEAIEVPLPAFDERLWFIRDFTRAFPDLRLEMTPEALAEATSGLSLQSINDIRLRAQAEGLLSGSLVKGRRSRVISSESENNLEIVEPKRGFDGVGGRGAIKEHLEGIISALEGRVAQAVPRGILFEGPPGTGKACMAEALSKESGLDLARFNYMAARSECALSKAFGLIKSLAPIVILIEEIEGTRAAMGDLLFDRLTRFMADEALRGEVLWIGTTSRPGAVDPSLGRVFDERFHFPSPSSDEREEILRTILRTRGDIPIEGSTNLLQIARDAEGLTEADMENLLRRGYRRALRAGRLQMNEGDVLTCLKAPA